MCELGVCMKPSLPAERFPQPTAHHSVCSRRGAHDEIWQVDIDTGTETDGKQPRMSTPPSATGAGYRLARESSLGLSKVDPEVGGKRDVGMDAGNSKIAGETRWWHILGSKRQRKPRKPPSNPPGWAAGKCTTLELAKRPNRIVVINGEQVMIVRRACMLAYIHVRL